MLVSAKGIRLFSAVIPGGLLLVLSACLGGCSKDYPPEEYGNVVHEVPSVAGAEKPFKMPKLGPPLSEEEKRNVRKMH
jgi:hypothetical protein